MKCLQARDAPKLLQRSNKSEPNRSSKVYNRLLADINAGKNIACVVGFEPFFVEFEKRPKDASLAIDRLVNELKNGLDERMQGENPASSEHSVQAIA